MIVFNFNAGLKFVSCIHCFCCVSLVLLLRILCIFGLSRAAQIMMYLAAMANFSLNRAVMKY